jgi:hypothetical protein
MTTMPNNTHSSQMSTPISSLPLKTNQQESDIDDPLIQSVLKDFENDSTRDVRDTRDSRDLRDSRDSRDLRDSRDSRDSQQHVMSEQQVYHVSNDANTTNTASSIPNMQVNYEELNYNGVGTNEKKKLINYEIAKRAAIISIIAFFIYNQNILGMLISKLPDSVTAHINGKEFLLYILLSFLILYGLLYFDLM